MQNQNKTILLDKLPVDILMLIFRWLDLKSLVNTKIVCKKLNNLIKANQSLFNNALKTCYSEILQQQFSRFKAKPEKRKFLIEEMNQTENIDDVINQVTNKIEHPKEINAAIKYIAKFQKVNSDKIGLANSFWGRMPLLMPICFVSLSGGLLFLSFIFYLASESERINNIEGSGTYKTLSTILFIISLIGILASSFMMLKKIGNDGEIFVYDQNIDKLDDQSPLLIKDDVQNSASSFGSNV